MRKKLLALFLALAPVSALMLGSIATPAQAQVTASMSLFYKELAPYGRWFQHPRYGWTWFPTAVEAGWRPYSRGEWAWTDDYGWYWESDEPFGWVVYHYGRWIYEAENGWLWIPGAEWSPAWVAFRDGDDEIGWAPLPPEASDDLGFDAAYTDLGSDDYLSWWVFVPRRHFLDRHVYRHADRIERNRHFHRRTHDVTHYVRVNSRIVNRSLDRQRLESALGRHIAAVHLHDVGDSRAIVRRGGDIGVYRPHVRLTNGAAPPESMRGRPADRARVPAPSPPETVRPAAPARPPEAPTVLHGVPGQPSATAPHFVSPHAAEPHRAELPPAILRGMPAERPPMSMGSSRPHMGMRPPHLAPGAGPSHGAPSFHASAPRAAPRGGGPNGGGPHGGGRRR